MKRVHLLISGKVQGVFYRSRTKDMADRLNLAGWVRNLDDGRVEAVFEGSKESVERMISWCKEGSPASDVSHVEIAEEPFEGDRSSFNIRYR